MSSLEGQDGVKPSEDDPRTSPEVPEASHEAGERSPMPAEDWIYAEAPGGESDAEEPVREGPRPAKHRPYRSRLVQGVPEGVPGLTQVDTSKAEWRLLLLDTWQRSGLPARDFLALIGNIVNKHTLYAWKRRFEAEGAAGPEDRVRRERRTTDRLTETTRRAIVMMKAAHPEWGVQRISDSLLRGPGLSASPTTVLNVLHEQGYSATTPSLDASLSGASLLLSLPRPIRNTMAPWRQESAPSRPSQRISPPRRAIPDGGRATM
jgi:transposase